MNEDLVTVVIPIYNGAEFLQETIDSVLKQTHQNFEIICVDDLSSDSSRDILTRYQNDSRFKILFNNCNLGLNPNIAKAIRHAAGDYICILGQDDILPPEKFLCQIQFLKESGKDVVYAAHMTMNEKSQINQKSRPDCSEFTRLLSKDPRRLYEIVCTAEPGHFMPMSQSALFKAKVLKDLNPMRSRICLDDWPVLVKCLEQYKVGFMDEVMFYWRLHSSNNSKNIWWNLGISLQTAAALVPEEYKIPCIANNFYYTATQEMANKNNTRALKFILCALVLSYSSDKRTLLFKILRKIRREKIRKITKKLKEKIKK